MVRGLDYVCRYLLYIQGVERQKTVRVHSMIDIFTLDGYRLKRHYLREFALRNAISEEDDASREHRLSSAPAIPDAPEGTLCMQVNTRRRRVRIGEIISPASCPSNLQ